MKSYWSNIKAIVLLATLFIFILIADIIGMYLYYNNVLDFINSQPKEIKADAGIIFFGDYIESGTKLGPDSEQRALKAIHLYKTEQIENIICIGGYYFKRWKGKPHLMSEFLLEHDIPKNKIMHDSLSFNTITNCTEVMKIVNRKNYQSIVAISAPLHIFRIADELDFDNAYFLSYKYSFNCFNDYWVFSKDVHHEWRSNFLSFVLKDEVRNKLLDIYSTIEYEIQQKFIKDSPAN